eukprot:TRINITY_DN6277_c0_g1_i2.p2 TRINITY_DN6277_c0_g1~~TRINITY_DN6277_c0_g1_i2.p2  ORF type:complete len:108 (-),score=27.49 TRINITY_DN6277_c0_g1_i2:284-607(-)
MRQLFYSLTLPKDSKQKKEEPIAEEVLYRKFEEIKLVVPARRRLCSSPIKIIANQTRAPDLLEPHTYDEDLERKKQLPIHQPSQSGTLALEVSSTLEDSSEEEDEGT